MPLDNRQEILAEVARRGFTERDILSRGNVQAPADRGAFGLRGALTDYGAGALGAAESSLRYIIDTPLQEMGSDAYGMGKAMVQGMAEEPMMTMAEMIPGVGPAMGVVDAENLRREAYQLEQEGRFEEAESRRALASTILGSSFIPGGRRAAKAARIAPDESDLRTIIMPGDVEYDARFSPRRQSQVNKVTGINLTGPEKARLDQARFVYDGSPIATPDMSIVDLEGKPFMTTMSDRTAAGYALAGIGDVQFDRPIMLRGGQDFMFDDPDLVWASDPKVVDQMSGFSQELATRFGQNPVFLPWRMAPSGGDYATMTTDVMFEYAYKNMDPKKAMEIDALIRKGKKVKKTNKKTNKSYTVDVAAPEWKGIKNPESATQIQNLSGDQRKLIQSIMDIEGRNAGGLSLGEARLAVSDPTQYSAAGGGMQNVGLVDALAGVTTSTHPTYRGGLYGEGIGRLKEDVQAYQLLPEAANYRMQPRFNDEGKPIQVMTDPRNPTSNDLRALQMKPYGGVITEQIIRSVLEGN